MSYSFAVFLQALVKSYVYIALLPSKLLNENKYISSKSIISTLLIAILIANTSTVNFIVKSLSVVIMNYFIIKNIYKKGNLISIMVSAITFVMIFIIDEFIDIIFIKLFKVDFIYIQYYPNVVLSMTLSLLVISVILCFFIKTKSFFEEIKEYSFEKRNMNIISLYLVLSILFFVLIGYSIRSEELLSKDYLIGVLLLSTYIVISIIYVIQIKELIRSKNDYDAIYNYISNVEKVAGQLKKQEHEHNNQLIAIKAFAQDEKSKEIISFVENVIKNKIKTKISANVGLEKIQDNMLKTLLVHKINGATGIGLRIEAFIRRDIASINNISPKDLANIIGIIMDNAIEGAIDSEEKYISILIDEDEDCEEVNITVSNTYKEAPKIYEAGISTKGEYRGNGLSILQEIEEENDKIKINTEITEDLFIQDIFIIR